MKNLFALLLCIFPFVLQAQAPVNNYWSATLHIGPFASGVSNYLEERMKLQGYYPHTDGIFGGGSPLPMARQNPVYQLAIERNWRRSWSAKFLESSLGGNLSGISSQNGDLEMEYKINTLALLGGYHFKQEVVRVAVGPACHFIRVKANRPFNANGPLIKKFTKIGITGELGLRFPAATLFFFDFNTQYQRVGKIDMGSYDFKEVDSAGQPYTSHFNVGSKSFTYLAFNFGLGARIGNFLK